MILSMPRRGGGQANMPAHAKEASRPQSREASAATGTRARSKTLTTPLATPAEELNGFSWNWSESTSPTSTNHFEALPRELQTHVLFFLQTKELVRCMPVCRAWQELVYDGALWKVLDTETFYAQIPAVQLRKMLERAAPYVQHLNLRGCTQLRDDMPFTFVNLQSINFEGCRTLGGGTLNAFFSRHENLAAVDVSGLQAIDASSLLALESHSPRLEALNISYTKNVLVTGMAKTLKAWPELQDLRIAECGVSSAVMHSIHGLKRLRRLCLSGCLNLKDTDLKTMIYGHAPFGLHYPERTARMTHLVHLDISRTRLTDACIQYMCGTLPKLEKLEVAGITELTDAGITQLVQHCPRLTHVDFEDCSIGDGALQALASSCRKLRHLQLSHCSNITDIGVLQLIDNLPALQHLDLDNTKITNRVLSGVAAKTTSMRISLYDCPNISWTGVLSILTSNSTRPTHLKKLKTFYGWQRPVDGHTRAILKGDLHSAREIEKAWTQYMMQSSEEIMRGEAGRSRFLGLDVGEAGPRIVGRETRRRRGCVIM
ncbi:hypothetical protein BCR37DRAFT_379038 [Protomyces lactucae-debilis]|uniref:F-box domain-containing protein n=1 Tax=Protomyces lactucae-debilis TaxID=2754530 RepID=A0A1Y2FI76_PROLT|nr:uncharacterized protein BCR37DRAFT_379038 [Protomyces lactucae-debilis]ORY83084.1 hypothetical protein BCR37DRAFT_379038 [Protomyces lactucae-debilis]